MIGNHVPSLKHFSLYLYLHWLRFYRPFPQTKMSFCGCRISCHTSAIVLSRDNTEDIDVLHAHCLSSATRMHSYLGPSTVALY